MPNNTILIISYFVSFLIGSILTFIIFKRKKQSCAYYDDSWDKLKYTWIGYFELFKVVRDMFEDNVPYEDIREVVLVTYDLISKGEEKFYNE